MGLSSKKTPPLANHLFDNFCLNMGDSCYSSRSTVVMVVMVLVVVAVVVVVVLAVVILAVLVVVVMVVVR